MTILRVVDIETTGTDPTEHAIVEIAATDVHPERRSAGQTFAHLVKPPHPIPPEAMAVHHILDEDVADAAQANEVVPLVLVPDDEPIYVAHNAAFEMGFLAPWLPDAQWLCTYKATLRVWPEAPSHSNQVLRYWLGIQVLAGEPHRAGPDTIVTARILLKLLEKASIEDMLAWTKEPPVMPRITIGEHRGKP